MSATKLHADDSPVPVLAPGNGKTKSGRLWVYGRDDRANLTDSRRDTWLDRPDMERAQGRMCARSDDEIAVAGAPSRSSAA